MNLIVDSPTWLVAILVIAMLAAAAEDAWRLRISNITCGVVLVTAIIAMALHGFPLALWQNAVVFIVVLAIGTLLFASGQMGGGDIKLLACLGLWMNFMAAIWFVASTLIAGGVLALGFIATRPLRRKKNEPLGRAASRNIPYGIAIAAGACLIFAGQLGLMQPKGASQELQSVAKYHS